MEEDNRKNVNRIKRFIIGSILVLIFVPIILCIVMMVKIGKLEKKLDDYLSKGTETTAISASGDLSASNSVFIQIANRVIDEGNRIRAAADPARAKQMAKDDANAINILEKDIEPDELYKTTASVTDAATAADAEVVTEATATEAVEETPVPNGQRVYLTFDDGPSKYTDDILKILDEKGVKATFFVVADDYSYSDELRRIVDEGHTLAMHSMCHKYDVIYKDLESFKADVNGLHDLLLDITGVDVKYYRFPGGSSNTVSSVPIRDCISYLESEGIEYFDWNALNGDAEYVDYTADQLNKNVMKYVHANHGDSVVLLHDQGNHGATVEALPKLIDTLLKEGYEVLPIDETTKPVHHIKDEEEEEVQ